LARDSRRFKQGDFAGIGSLEARVLRALWTSGGWASTAVIHAKAREEARISYNSVHTCLQRMAKKGYLLQRQDGRGVWSFLPAMSQEEMVVSLVGNIWEFLVGRPPAVVCRFLTDALLGQLSQQELRGSQRIPRKRHPGASGSRTDDSAAVENTNGGTETKRSKRSRSRQLVTAA